MITFKDFITEEQVLDDAYALKVAKTIVKNCGPYLKQIGHDVTGNILYRGIKNTPDVGAFATMKPNKRRKPSDTSLRISRILNSELQKQFGANFRSAATFCTGNRGIASDYGQTHIVFPAGNFKFCWSKQIQDAYPFFDGSADVRYPAGLDIICKALGIHRTDIVDPRDTHFRVSSKAWADTVQKFLQKKGHEYYSDQDIRAAIKSKNEIMVVCDRYYTLSLLNKEYDNFADLVLETIEELLG